MQVAVVVMTILGCGDQSMSCDFIPRTEKTWNNKAACEVAIPRVLGQIKDANYPILTASCDIKYNPEQSRTLEAKFEPTQQKPSEYKNASQDVATLSKPNMFEKIRNKAVFTDAGLIAKVKTSLNYVTTTTNRMFNKIKDIIPSN